MFIKIFHRLIIAFSLLILCYTFYKSEIHWQGTLRNKYLFYYILSFILIFFSIILFFLSKEIKIYITIIFLSILFTVYSYEGYLVLKENNIENFKKKLFLSKTGMKFDTRKLDEVYKDLKKIDNNTVFKSYPKWSLNDDNKEYFPLSGKSLSKTIFCNENGYYSIYESDRYGFNNPDTEWDANKIEYLLLGDSFTHGACVNRPNDIASVLRKLSGSSAINLGMRGNGPLIELASLKEYLTNNTKKIIWIYFEGNDLTDLKYELENKLLLKYLSDDEFRQNLSSKQSLIDQNIVIN